MTEQRIFSEEPEFLTGLGSDVWPVPGIIDVDASVLTFAHSVSLARGRRRDMTRIGRPVPTLLPSFVRLSGSAEPAAAVLRFARRHGVLHLCLRHGLPATHAPLPHARPPLDDDSRDCSAELHWSESEEPIARWLDYSREAGAILAISNALHQEWLGLDETWRVLGDRLAEWPQLSFLLVEKPPDNLVLARSFIAWLVDRWVTDSGIKPRIVWRQGIDILLGGGGLFGALAAQLVFAVAKAAPLTTCSYCGQIYAPTRQPRAGERRFCLDCRQQGIPARLAQQDRRARLSRLRSGDTDPSRSLG